MKADEMRMQISYSGLCHTDAMCVRSLWGPCAYPMVPGHEMVGTITMVGASVKGFSVGDQVGFGP